MEFKFILGVDMSKETFNFCLMSTNFTITWEGEIENQPDAIFKFISQLLKRPEISTIKDLVIVMEHTGIYVQHLVRCWLSKNGALSIVPAVKVSEHLGGQTSWTEKTDELDARRLAEYGIRYIDKLELWQAKEHLIEQLQRLQRQRRRFIDAINLLEVPVNESIKFDTKEISDNLVQNQQDAVQALKSDLKKVKKQLNELIENDPTLKQLFKLITSVDGVGLVTATEVIIATSAFTDFGPNEAKSFARYAGVVPLKKQSGKMKKKSKTSKRSNKKIKTVLTMGAISLIGTDSDLGRFYERKMAEGKHHLSVINAMRNKIILRIFAVVRNQVMYDKKFNLIQD